MAFPIQRQKISHALSKCYTPFIAFYDLVFHALILNVEFQFSYFLSNSFKQQESITDSDLRVLNSTALENCFVAFETIMYYAVLTFDGSLVAGLVKENLHSFFSPKKTS